MNWDEYVEFTDTTAVYPKEHEATYLTLGLYSEVGELCGKVKKSYRDGDGSVPVDGVAAELGDVFWYLARLMKLRGGKPQHDEQGDPEPTLLRSLQRLGWYAGELLSEGLRVDYADTVLSRCHLYASDLAKALNRPVEGVWEANAKKLQSRKDRGTLQGSGDQR